VSPKPFFDQVIFGRCNKLDQDDTDCGSNSGLKNRLEKLMIKKTGFFMDLVRQANDLTESKVLLDPGEAAPDK